jgi:nucleoside-diphosphate-sugar epimerase
MQAPGRTFLLGAGGWLGRSIGHDLPDAIALATAQELRRFVLTNDDAIINAAGSKDPATMQEANVDLVARLIESAEPAAVPIVHLGSAAEYGIPADGSPLVEDAGLERPGSAYGRTKLAATRLLQRYGNACVLRVFNIVANPPQPGSPLEEITGKAMHAVASGRAPELWAATTSRDWVTRDFVVRSVLAAVRLRPAGVYNVCSGEPVAMADLVRALLERQGSGLPIVDLQQVPANSVVGDPRAWRAASGLGERLTAEKIAAILLPNEEAPA